MHIIEQRYLRGPNLYSEQPCLLAVVALDGGDAALSRNLPALANTLMRLLPGLAERCPGSRYPDGFDAPLRSGAARPDLLPGVLEQMTLALQRAVGMQVAFGGVRPAPAFPGCWEVVIAYRAERVVDHALTVAVQTLNALQDSVAHDGSDGAAPDLHDALQTLQDLADRSAIGTSTGAVLREAHRRGIPSVRLTDEANLFLLGWGKRQRRLQATITGNTSHVAVGIASDKQLTKSLLLQAGLPVPEGETVTTVEQACAVAARLQGPVTIKPLDANHGKGVSTTCVTPEDIAIAFDHARNYSRRIIVERFLRGGDYRVLVTGDRVAAAALRRPPQVIGDGVSSVRELVEQENRNPARGAGHTNILTRIALDDHALEVLHKQGADFDTVLAAGQTLALRDNANLSSGGTAEDVTDMLPQETVRICLRAARAIGLDIAGIDIVCEDIARPLREQGGGIIEVNAAPGIRMHEYPSAGQPRDAGDAIAEALFGHGNGRIPVVAVSGSHGAATSVDVIAQAARVAGLVPGTATGACIRVGEAVTMQGNFAGYRGARGVLADPEVDLAVLETSIAGVVETGLGFDRCDVAVIVRLEPASAGQPMDEQDTHALAGVDAEAVDACAVLARSAARVVLNAEDEGCIMLGATLPAEVETLYFARHDDNPVLLRHLASGGRGLYLQGGTLVLASGQCHQAVLEIGAPTGTQTGGAALHMVELLAAAAALVGAGFAHQAVAAGLQSVAWGAAPLGSAPLNEPQPQHQHQHQPQPQSNAGAVTA